jgi:NADP-dependent 3-hydroxy acid dehydrogenase YdfG
MTRRFENKIVVVTGTSSGIGKAAAIAYRPQTFAIFSAA